MSEHCATLAWRQQPAGFEPKTFTRNHTVRFANGAELAASSAPDFGGDPARVDPEALLVAAAASCHMLTFLFLCAREALTVLAYEDRAVGHLERNEARQFAITRITLQPRVQFAPGIAVAPEKLADLHHRAHAGCFVANSIKARVQVMTA